MYLLDSDVARKLAQYCITVEFLSAYETTSDQVSVLPALRFQLKLNDKDKAVSLLGSEEAYLEICNLLKDAEEAIPIDSEKANEILAMNQSNLDIGEQTLLAVLASDPTNKLISGDKRAFVAISELTEQLIVSMWPNLICLEESMHLIVQKNDFTVVSEKVRSRPDVDGTFKLVFGVSEATSKGAVLDALNVFISVLVEETKYLYCMNK